MRKLAVKKLGGEFLFYVLNSTNYAARSLPFPSRDAEKALFASAFWPVQQVAKGKACGSVGKTILCLYLEMALTQWCNGGHRQMARKTTKMRGVFVFVVVVGFRENTHPGLTTFSPTSQDSRRYDQYHSLRRF
ncbi:MAG: hypothetical protein HYR83_10585 [Planctomycetes bacterium]|nr:hypothetical protein [Planctomycetota bacterium]